MAVQAQLADGTVLEFPDGTDPSVIQLTVKKHLGTSAASAPEGGGLLDTIRKLIGTDKASAGVKNQEYDKVRASQDSGAPQFSRSRLASGVEAVRPFSIPAALAAAGETATMAPLPLPLKALAGAGVGAATYLGLDSPLRSLSEWLNPGESASPAANLAINEVGGRILGAGMKKLTPSQETISKLGGTASQMLDSPVLKTIEDLFAPKAKAAALQNSSKLGSDAIASEASLISGRSPKLYTDPEMSTVAVQRRGLKPALDASFQESNNQAQMAKLIAKGNPETTLSGRVVEGPVNLRKTLETANQVIQANKDLQFGPAESDKPLLNKVFKLIDATGAQFDQQTGQLISAEPASFEETWNLKQGLDDLGGWNKNRSDLTPTDTKFRQLAKNINEDIEGSIGKWQNDPSKTALTAWKNAKETVAQRHAIFYAEGSGNKLGNIIDEVDSPLPAVNKILDDPRQLQRALNAGEIQFPSGAVYSTNLKRDLGAWNLIRMRDAAKTEDGMIDGRKLLSDWNDPRFVQQKKALYSSQQRADYDQLFKNISAVQQKQLGLGSFVAKVRMGPTGFLLAPSMIASAVSGNPLAAGKIAAVELGMGGVAKLMANPKTARILVTAAAGSPLSMSDTLAARLISAGLQSSAITLQGSDGQSRKGSIDRDGQFQEDQR